MTTLHKIKQTLHQIVIAIIYSFLFQQYTSLFSINKIKDLLWIFVPM